MQKPDNNSRKIIDAQQEIHPNLEKVVRKHCKSPFHKPIAKHTQDAFDNVKARIENALEKDTPLLFDSFCGTAMSTRRIAKEHPNALVVGIDRSEVRLSKQNNQLLPENIILLQADCWDFWRLAVNQGWQVNKHYLLYPNPYPKAKHLKRRIHGHPSYRYLLQLGGEVELRTNWEIYAREFKSALQYADIHNEKKAQLNTLKIEQPMTLFEKKYLEAGHELFVCKYGLN